MSLFRPRSAGVWLVIVLIFLFAFGWRYWRWVECRKVGHGILYCFAMN